MEENKKKMWFSTIMLVVALIVITISITASYYIVYRNDFKTEKIVDVSTECIEVIYDEKDTISLTDQYPVSDEYALKNMKPVTVIVHNKCKKNISNVKYMLALTSLSNQDNVKKYIPDNKMRIQVTRDLESNNQNPSVLKAADYLNSLTTIETNILEYDVNLKDKIKDYSIRNSYLIDENIINSGEIHVYQVYLWVDYYENGENNSTQQSDFRSTISLIVNPDGAIQKNN